MNPRLPAALVALLIAGAAEDAEAQRRNRDRPYPPLDEVRSIDGSGNNLLQPDRGAAFTPLVRDLSVAYADRVHAPAGGDRASARHVSNEALHQTGDRPNAQGLSDLFWQWGQFLDHDITETPLEDPAIAFPIAVPAGDPYFDPQNTGSVTIPLSRSFTTEVAGVRDQVNAITAWIDGSQVYGSDDERAQALRTLDGTGRLKTSDGDLLPFNTDGLHNAPTDHDPSFFLAGDIRANEQVGLTALHVVFVREHNWWADRIRRDDREWIRRRGQGNGGNGGQGGGRRLTRDGFDGGNLQPLTGDQIYELARAIVSAELQLITYREWLPHLLGEGVLDEQSVYDPAIEPGIRNGFATAAFRLGHSMLSPNLLRLDEDGDEIAQGHLTLAGAFFRPNLVIETGIDPLLRGLRTQRAQELDAFVIDDVRNFLFGRPGAGGFDLGALNIQRGRDHGLPGYGRARRDLGLAAVSSFAEMTSDPEVAARLARSARTPDSLDLWVGGLAEDHVPGALVGPTFHRILTRQFRALRDGDRLWYSRQLPEELREKVERQDMARVLARTSGLSRAEARDPFRAR